MSIAGILPSQIPNLTADQIAALTQDDIASLSIPQLRHLTPAQFAEFSVEQIGFFSTTQIADLANATVGALAPATIAEFSIAQLLAIRPAQATTMTAAQTAALSPDQVAALSIPIIKHFTAPALQALNGLTVAQVSILPPANIALLSVAQFAALVAADTAAYGAGRFVDVTAAQMAAFTTDEANGLTAGRVQAFTAAAIGGMSAAALGGLRTALTQALTANQLNGMGSVALCELDASEMSATQIGSLTAATIAALSTAQFDELLGGHIAAISTQALLGVSLADLGSLNVPELAAFTTAQKAAMTPAQLAILQGGTNAVMQDLATHETNGALSYAGALQVLQDAASGGMNAAKFSTLTTIANWLKTGSIQASAYVAQIFGDVVLGNSANAWWTGGASTRVTLGDLSAASTQTQANELIGKWFLGTDLPSFAGFDSGFYQSYTLPLFTTQGPQVSDINQGEDGDCYFLAGLAATVKQDPTLIRNMIQQVGSYSYSVEFQVNGEADYVTVTNQTPNFTFSWGNGSNMQFANSTTSLWVPLIEKAYAQLTEQTDVFTFNVNANSYAAINGGDSNGMTAITGQSAVELDLSTETSTSIAQSYLSQAISAFNAGQDVMVGTGYTSVSNDWVEDHMYAVVGANAAAGTLTLYNPWGVGATSNGMDATFTANLAQLQQEGVTLLYAVGKSATA